MRQHKHRTTSTYALKLTKYKPLWLYCLTHTTGVYYGIDGLITMKSMCICIKQFDANKGYKSNYARTCMPQLRLKGVCSS